MKRKPKTKTLGELLEAYRHFDPPGEFYEDDPVVLNTEKIRSAKGYQELQEKYRQFVEENEGTVFTAHIERPTLVSFKEDPTWWFYSGDLLPAKKGRKK